jgi:hypothetical protein
MYGKPCAIVVTLLHILIPDKKWINICYEVWTSFKSLFGRSDKILGFVGFISPSIFPILNLKSHMFDPKPCLNPTSSGIAQAKFGIEDMCCTIKCVISFFVC